jgi:hypothetical protein
MHCTEPGCVGLHCYENCYETRRTTPPACEPGRRMRANVSGGPLVTYLHDRKDNPMNDPTAKTTAEWPGIAEAADLLNFRIGEWHDFGYATPPAPDCKAIPPLGERSAEAIKGAYGAIEVIDEIVRDLHRLREQLIGELRANEDALNARVDRTLAEYRARQEADVEASPVSGSPARDALEDELGRLRRSREAWEQTARACACPPGACARGQFRDHAGQSRGCVVCADLDPDQPCYAAAARGLRAREEARR